MRLIPILVILIGLVFLTLFHYGYINIRSPHGMIKLGFLLLGLGGLLTYAKKLEDMTYISAKTFLYLLAVILILFGFWNLIGQEFKLWEPVNPLKVIKDLISRVVP